MRPAVRKVVARAYRLTTRPSSPGADEPIEVKPGLTVPRFVLDWSRSGLHEARIVLGRLAEFVEVEGRSVLTLGRGAGDLGIEVARRGARRVMAIDMVMPRMQLSEVRLEEEEEEEGGRLPVEIRAFSGSLTELGDERFEVMLAVDAFREYGAERSGRHLDALVSEMSSHLEDRGLLAVELRPPWKAPYGGSVDSRLPWAHLIFPESVVLEEYRRAHSGSSARTFDDLKVNRITLARFRQAMKESGLECLSLETNVSDSRVVGAMRVLSRLTPLEEYFTQNVYGVWRRP
jgi:predicted nicotinamide N-methyase